MPALRLPSSMSAVFFLVFLLSSASSRATLLLVPEQYLRIQDAIEAAQMGDTVLVNSGDYPEHVNLGSLDLTVASYFLMTGDSTYIHDTRIIAAAPGIPIVEITGGQTPQTLLAGFTISGGMPPHGSGVLLAASSPTIAHNIITNNCTEAEGGGIHITGGAPGIRFNRITGN
ncbi:MAG: hypothetical protein GF355_14890 [Candidatus Eisenbacteria bacterium]|nr:hypothetical protein [Candidatus Eisenbacteria bacterium]